MTKKHVIEIARILRNTKHTQSPDGGNTISYNALVFALANYLEELNPRFDFNRFCEACETN